MTSGAATRIRKMLTAWLMNDQADLNRLVEWLEGYGIAAGSESEEPYSILLEGLRGLDRNLQHRFLLRVQALLQERPDVRPLGDHPEEMLYNLLRICGGLGKPDVLAEPLHAMLRREALSMKFRGLDLRHVLRDALIRNQKDNSLLPIWQSMTDDQLGHRFLPGGVRQGLEGILWMPVSEEHLPNPDEEALGGALATFTQSLEKKSNREDLFQEALHRTAERWGSRMWEVFPRLSDDYGWPQWAHDLVVSFIYRDPPARTPATGPYLRVIATLQRESANSTTAADRAYYFSLIKTINERVFGDPAFAKSGGPISDRDRQAQENHILNSVENEFRQRGQEEIAELIQAARYDYMVERGIPVAIPA